MKLCLQFGAVVLLAALPLTAQPASETRSQAEKSRVRERPAPQPFVPPHLVMERLSRMSPEELRRMLDRLPPDKRRITEERLHQLASMPPAARERLRQEFNDFLQLTPEKQQELRLLFRRYSDLPEARRPDVRRELSRLRAMPPARRAARIGEEAFRSEFNDDEREILQGLVEVLPPPPPAPPLRRTRPEHHEPVN